MLGLSAVPIGPAPGLRSFSRRPFASGGAEVPLRTATGTPCVRIRVAGRPLWFLLDSGAAFNRIEPGALRGLAGVARRENDLDPGDGDAVVRVPRVEIGEVALPDQTFLEAPSPFGNEGERPEDRVVGVLGYSALRLLTIGIDFRSRRLWAWSPEHLGTARRTLFGSAETAPLAAMRAGSLALPIVRARFAGTETDVVLDTGSYLSNLTPTLARRVRTHLTPGPTLRFTRTWGKVFARTALLDRTEVGRVAWSGLSVLLGIPGEDLPPFLGITALYPFGAVLLDFGGGSIEVARSVRRVSFLDSLLSLYSGYEGPGRFTIGSRRVAIGTVRAVGAISTAGLHETARPWPWPVRERASRLRFGATQPALVKTADGARLRTDWINGNLRSEASVGLGPPRTRAGAGVSPFAQPGYYLVWNGHAHLLPAGPAWAPREGARFVAVGGLPPLPRAAALGAFQRIAVPGVRDGSVPYWAPLGWRRPDAATFYSRTGTETPLAALRPEPIRFLLDPDVAFAAGTRRVAFDAATGALTLR